MEDTGWERMTRKRPEVRQEHDPPIVVLTALPYELS